MSSYCAGIDIGGTNTRIALIDESLCIHKRIQFPTITEDPIKHMEYIKEQLKSFNEKILAIGVSCPGPLDLKNGIVLTPPNLKSWHMFPIKEMMEKLLHIPVQLENDANLACLGEAKIGAGKGLSIIQYLTISTGVGSGFVINNEIYQGAHGFAHEIANMILWKDGPAIGDLKAGSIESIASGTAICERAKSKGLCVEHAGQVHALALQGNEDAICIMEDAKEYLANAIAILFAVNDPDTIILGGSVALKIDGFIEDIQVRVKQKVYDNLKDYVKIEAAQLGDDSGLIGAAALAFDSL